MADSDDVSRAGALRVLLLATGARARSDPAIAAEIDAIGPGHEVRVEPLDAPDARGIAMSYDAIPRAGHERLAAAIDHFRPNVLHAHGLSIARLVAILARRHAIPFTVRAYGDEVVVGPAAWWPGPTLVDATAALDDDACLGVLADAHHREVIERAGVRAERIVDAPPPVVFERFHDRTPNGDAVMAAGSASPRRRLGDFVELAARAPAARFDLYLRGGDRELIGRHNASRGSPVRIRDAVEHRLMPREYKAHRWLVHTGSRLSGATGRPASVIEAQAAGVGVCVAALHRHAEALVGGAGFVFRDLDEAAAIVSRPCPAEIRERGFEVARACDARIHVARLVSLWRAGIAAPDR